MKANIKKTISTKFQYTMEYNNFNETKNTSVISMIEFLSDIK
jgi:hypothetical protein